jgi:serine protease
LVTLVAASLAIGAAASVDATLTSALAVQAAAAARPAYDSRTITVKFRDAVSLARIDGVTASLGGRVTYVSKFTPGLRVVSIPTGADVWRTVNEYRRRLDVDYAEPTYLDYPAWTPNDPRYPQQWNFRLTHLPEAWDKQRGGSRSIVVCVVDTGVAFENYENYLVAPDLAGAHFVDPYDVVDGDAHPDDDTGHGTHMAGTIAQQTDNNLGVAGVAFGVSLMPVRTLGPGGGSLALFSDGVKWAVAHGAQIINYSAGGVDSTTKHDAVLYAHDHGVLLVAAYGNQAQANPPDNYPGQYPEALGVGAVDRHKALTYYSNWGDGVDVVAPGGDTRASAADGIIQNTFIGSPTDFGYYGFMGTSTAAAHVSGLAALLWSQGIYNTREAVFARLTSMCEDLGVAGYDKTFGWGLVNANAALGTGPPKPPVLSWAGTPGFETDGVNPDSAPVRTIFNFQVRYADPGGIAATTAQLVIQRNGAIFKRIPLSPAPGGGYATGKIYRARAGTGQSGTYQYRFRLTHGTRWATGAPANWTPGPTITP